MADLRTDYKDDVLNINTNERRKYRMINNADGTISFEDVTDYLQYGDSFGALDLNAITNAIMNECLKRTDVVDNLESTATDVPLSPNMGRVLNEKFGLSDVITFNLSTGVTGSRSIRKTKDGSDFVKIHMELKGFTCNANTEVRLGSLSESLGWKTFGAMVFNSGGNCKGIATVLIIAKIVSLVSNVAISSTDFIVCAN